MQAIDLILAIALLTPVPCLALLACIRQRQLAEVALRRRQTHLRIAKGR